MFKLKWFYEKFNSHLYFGIPGLFNYKQVGNCAVIEFLLLDVFIKYGNSYSILGMKFIND